MVERQAIFPEGRQDIYERHGYSAAIRSGDFLFVSGQVGSGEDGKPVGNAPVQYRKAFQNLAAVLKAAGCTVDDIVDITSFHVDFEEHMKTFADAKSEVFGAPPYPNWTAIGVSSLGGFLFEIKVIARIPGETL